MMPEVVSVIPNAVDASVFTPDPSRRKKGRGKWKVAGIVCG